MKIAVTQGESTGIGPEILLKALARFEPTPGTKVLVLGCRSELDELAEKLAVPPVPDLMEVPGPSVALSALEEAAALAAAGEAQAVVTAPVNKAKLHRAGFEFPGQTEFFAGRLGAERFAMMLAAGGLRVVPLTTHVALAAVPGLVTVDEIVERTKTISAALAGDFGIAEPDIAILGLNPHAGEEGAFGDEEKRLILPAIIRLRAGGHSVQGPLPADAAFARRARAGYDAILGMYHDQVLAPFKALSSGHGVNVTLGLPVIRTSPDHGSAEDIAGRGVADPSSMLEALVLAESMARRRFGARDR